MDFIVTVERDGDFWEADCNLVKGGPFSGRTVEEAVRTIAYVALLQLALEVSEGRHRVLPSIQVRCMVVGGGGAG
jgi:hypothetical protein